LQEFQFVTDVEARDVMNVVCRAMHGPENDFVAFAPMSQLAVFEKLVGFKPHELLFLKTSAAIKYAQNNRIRVHVHGPELDGNMFEIHRDKENGKSLAQFCNDVDVINCVVIGVDVQHFSLCIGNCKWMMAMHEFTEQSDHELRRKVLPKVAKDPFDTVIRYRLSSLPWFKNISINEAKQVR
jgi:hypothetical protein